VAKQPLKIHDEVVVFDLESDVLKTDKQFEEDFKKLQDFYAYTIKHDPVPIKTAWEPVPWTTVYTPMNPAPTPKPIPDIPCKSSAQEATENGVPDHKNVYKHLNELCICGKNGGSHYGFKCYFNGPPGEFHLKSSEIMPTTTKKNDIPPKDVLDLVPGSVPEDWHRHHQGNGWVYKNAKVAGSASVYEGAVVYDNAKVMSCAVIYEQARIFGNAVINSDCYVKGHAKIGGDAVVHYASHISGYAKIFGTVENYCQISGKTYVKPEVVVSAHSKLSATPVVYRTQKAKGLSILATSGFDVPENKMYKIERLKTKKQLENLIGNFVRPCPVTPRHGFVDSRSVTTLDDVKNLIKETKAADKQAEFIVMPFIKASHSGIWTEGQLSVGTGNDGATSGRDSLIIPIQGVPSNMSKSNWDNLLKNAGITQSPYMELLWIKTVNQKYLGGGEYADNDVFTTKFVQLRDGPKLPNSVNFIPKETTVTNIVLAEGDLLKWESDVKDFKPGTVVYHPGGSLASHYAIHAYLNNIPVLIDKEPHIGDILKPDTEVLKSDISKLKKGFQLGCTIKCSYQDAAYIMMAGCHSTSQWLGRSDLFLGMAMGCCYRLLVAASLGEFRRHKSHILHEGDSSIGSREKVYKDVWDIILTADIQTRFAAAMKSFDEDLWGGSIGGVNWFILSRWGALVYNSLIDGDEKTALEALNKGVNSVHNGGWTFNKFIGHDEMNNTAKNPVYALLKVAPLLYDSVKLNFIENQTTKYEIKDILDIEDYIAEHKKKIYEKTQKKSTSSVKNTSKKCCSNDCCGNPDCTECHPVNQKIPKSCLFEGKMVPHSGKETLIITTENDVFPVCEAHLDEYLIYPSMYSIYKPICPVCNDNDNDNDNTTISEAQFAKNGSYFCNKCCVWFTPETSLLSEPKTDCDCGEHSCSDCYPDGCGCECTTCHDQGCVNCCGCMDHNCAQCYPEGCDCKNTECHDCGHSHCTECNPDHDEDHCPSCYGTSEGKCINEDCKDCYPEPETETK
jgi:hypothetical protein